jgi:N-acetylglucosaminyldiphosphoundecaprenol N-acetyl-beta-D-mannosaminyltransferase
VFVGSKQKTLIAIGDRMAEGVSTHVVTLNSEMVVNARRESHFREVLRSADIIVPDGVGVVWAARFLRKKRLRRLPGIDLAEGILRTAELAGRSVYLLGARPKVIAAARQRIEALYPRLHIAGSHHGYFQGQEEKVIRDIAQSSAEILLVGMGSPGQEYFIARTRERLPCRLMMGIGGSFDIWAGYRRRAAKWMQSLGLEWLHRAMVDVRRWRRLGFIPSFLWLVLAAKLTGRQTA